MSKTPTQSKRIAALNRSYYAGREEAFHDVADWLGLIRDEDDEPTEEEVKHAIIRLLGDSPPAAKDIAADLLCEMKEGDDDGDALFEHVLSLDWSLIDAAEEGYTGDEIASLNLDGAQVQTTEGKPHA